MFRREERLIGQDNLEKLKNSTVVVVGLGGVGGYVVEILARAGVGHLILCDGDKIDVSNLNRQIIATNINVGCSKVLEWQKRINIINKDCVVEVIDSFYTSENKCIFLDEKIDYIVDAIDDIKAKIDIIVTSKEKNIPIISAMGAGNRIDACDFQIVDIYKTSYDGLAKKLRVELKKQKINKLTVCCSNKPAVKLTGDIGSISYNPALSGVKIGSYVINQIIKG